MNNLDLAKMIWKYIDEEVLQIPSSMYLACSDEDAIDGIAKILEENPGSK